MNTNAVHDPAGRPSTASPRGAVLPQRHHWLSASSYLQVLFQEHKFRQVPFEWVYDGLAPVLLPCVLESRKVQKRCLRICWQFWEYISISTCATLALASNMQGLSIVLATIYLMVARRLGLNLVMVPERAASEDPPPGEDALLQNK